MKFEVIPLDSRDMIYAVIETPRDSTLEYTSAKCHELGAIAKGIDGITSVSSLAGYEIRTEGRDSNAGTCLIHLKDRSDRKLTSRQIIETLEEKCRTMNVDLEFFEPPAVSVFVAAGGFSVRVLDKTNSNDDGRPGGVPETFMDDLLKRKDLEGLFNFLASNYPQYELVINNDIARQKGVSIANALENLIQVVGGDDQAERKFRRVAEDFSTSVRQERPRGNGTVQLVHAAQDEAGVERDRSLKPESLRRHPRYAGSPSPPRSDADGVIRGARAFQADLEVSGMAARAAVLAFSQFGERVAKYATHGTDHGTVPPIFIVGDSYGPLGFNSGTDRRLVRFRLVVPLAERQRCQPSKLARPTCGRCPVRLPQGTSTLIRKAHSGIG